jgi:3-oxoacyl-[acyl-carrier-protein] synthase-3
VPILGVEITGLGSALPRHSVTNDELIRKYDLDSTDQKIRELSGIGQRYVCDEDENTLTLAVAASEEALEAADVRRDVDVVDYLILGTTTPVQEVPALAPVVHRELGLKNGFAYDVNSACTGFVTALIRGYQNFATEGSDRVLAVGADQLSRITDYYDRGTGILFGDGAGAALLERSNSQAGLLGRVESVDGEAANILYCNRGGKVQMEGREVMKRATRIMAAMGETAIERSNLTPDDIDLVVPHQANMRIIVAASRHLGIPMERIVTTLEQHGNTSSASIPLALKEAFGAGRIEHGQKLLLVGFGAGMTAAGAVIEW